MRWLGSKYYQWVVGLSGIVFLTFLPALFAPFKTLDDQYSIIDNPLIKSVSNIAAVMQSSYFGEGSYYRPLVSLSYMAEYYFWGLRPFFYNLDNVILHLLSALLVFAIFLRLGWKNEKSFFVALLFAVHPIQWEAVSNIPGRAILLSGFFSLLTFYWFLVGRQENKSRYFWLAAGSFIAGLLSKESAAMTPLVLGLYALCSQGWKGVRREGRFLLALIMIFCAYLIWRQHLGYIKVYHSGSWTQWALGVIAFLRGVFTYLGLLIAPHDLHFDRSQLLWLNFRLVELWETLGVYAGVVILLWLNRRKISWAIWFFIGWFWLELLPVSQIFSSIGTGPGYISLAEHFLYLASIGVFALLVLAGTRLCEAQEKRGWLTYRGKILLLVMLFFALILTTVEQLVYSSTEESMCRRTLQFNPDNTRINFSLGMALVKSRRLAEGEAAFRHVLSRDPFDKRAAIALAQVICDQGRAAEGIAVYEKAANLPGELSPYLKEVLENNYRHLFEIYKKKVGDNPYDAKAHFIIGIIYGRLGKPLQSIEAFENAVKLDPENKAALLNLGSLYEWRGEIERAAGYYGAVLLASGVQGFEDIQANVRLGAIFQGLGQKAKAQNYFDQADILAQQIKPVPVWK
ncbi:MAG: tetratricopeptide repeat protein [Candidatus Omnitrophica bacterium]|nr:tetratricopeptide repeat protein [Candidatus Omnitrophota bacterium]